MLDLKNLSKQSLIDMHTLIYHKSKEPNCDCTTYDMYCDDLAEIESELRDTFKLTEQELENTLVDYYKEEENEEVLSNN